MLTPEGGGIAERPLTATNTYNIRRSRNIKRCPGCCLRRRVVGVWGQSPREYGCRAESPAGCGQSPRFCLINLVNKRKLPPCGRHLPLNPLYGIFCCQGRVVFSPKISTLPLTIFDFFRDRKTESKPGILTCPNGQLQIPNPPERKEKKRI